MVNGKIGTVTRFEEHNLERLNADVRWKMVNLPVDFGSWMNNNEHRVSGDHSDQNSCSVRFPVVDFGNGGCATIIPYTFSCDVPGVGVCKRVQVPLRLAWAITHHKSQGQSLEAVKVDPTSFAEGQTYVVYPRQCASRYRKS